MNKPELLARAATRGPVAVRSSGSALFVPRNGWNSAAPAGRRGSGFDVRSSRTRSSDTLGRTRTGMASIVPAIAAKLGGVIGAGISS